MRGLFRPHPTLGRVYLSSALALAAVPDLVAGEPRVVQDPDAQESWPTSSCLVPRTWAHLFLMASTASLRARTPSRPPPSLALSYATATCKDHLLSQALREPAVVVATEALCSAGHALGDANRRLRRSCARSRRLCRCPSVLATARPAPRPRPWLTFCLVIPDPSQRARLLTRCPSGS